jgi:hypothetical protein
MKISYKIENGINHVWHPHPAFAKVPADDDELINQPNSEDNGAWLQETVNPAAVSDFWGNVIEDLRAKGELNEYHDDEADDYRVDPAYK